VLATVGMLLVVGLCMIGCGGSSSAATAGHKTALSERVSPRVAAEDRALGEGALLRPSDFPPEYEGGVRGGEEDESNPNRLLHYTATTCLHLDTPLVTRKNRATVSSGEFGDNTDESAPTGYIHIENTVTVEPAAVAAKTWFSIFDGPQTSRCMGEAFRAGITSTSPGLRKSGNSVGMARIAHLALLRYGDQSVAYRLTVPIVAEGHNFTTYLDYVLVRKGRAHMVLTFERLDSSVSGKLEQRLTALTARRLRD
jgi:hypothetical protein